MATKREGMPAAVRRVDEQFEQWRAGKQGQERIPPKLWAAAAKLCETHSVHRVSRWLGLNHTALQRRAGRRGRRGRAQTKQTFVEWRLPTGVVASHSMAEYVVEVGGRVPRVHVRGASATEVAALVIALCGPGGGS